MSSDRSPTRSDDGPAIRRVVAITQPDSAVATAFVSAVGGLAETAAELIETATLDAARSEIGRVIDSGVRIVAAVGGDGSINFVAGELIDLASSSGVDDVTLVPVPDGTVNLLAQVLAITSVDDAVRAVEGGATRALDVGRSDDGIFLLNGSSGYDAAVIDDADDHSGARFGRVRFARAGLRRMRRTSPRRVTVLADDTEVFDGRAMSVIVMNVGQRASGGFHLAPDAEPDDGILDVVIVRVDDVFRLVATVVRLALGREVPERDVVRAGAARVSVEWSSPVATQRDGDADGLREHISYGVARAAINVQVPPD